MQETVKQLKTQLTKADNTQSEDIKFLETPKFEKLLKAMFKKINKVSKQTFSRWSVQQNILYVRYIKANIKIMKSNGNFKRCRKFQRMSGSIVTKNANQCRSHHQKLLKKHNTIQNIISSYSNYFQNKNSKNKNKMIQVQVKVEQQEPGHDYIQQKQISKKMQNEEQSECIVKIEQQY